MSAATYNTLAGTLLGGSLLALFLAAAHLVAAIVGWRGPHRNQRLIRCALFGLMFPLLVAIPYLVLQPMYLRGLARQIRQASQGRIDAASLAQPGDMAPAFRIKDGNGNEFSIADQRGKVVLINFFATWCGPCLEELPHLEELWKANRNASDFSMLVIGREETTESVEKFRAEHGYSFPMAADPDCSVYLAYATKFIPRTFLVSRDGRICFASAGFSEQDLVTLRTKLTSELRTPK